MRLTGLQSEIDRLHREIAALGAVNLAALDELAAARELWHAREDLAQARDVAPGRVLPDAAIIDAVRETSDQVASSQSIARQQVEQRLAAAGIAQAEVTVTSAVSAHSVQRGLQLLPGVKNIIAVSSGKGGVGKSTTTVNLALALAAEGASVGILDADIYGPSQPMMMGIEGRPESHDGKTMAPLVNHGVQVMSIGFLVEPDQAMIWRGPMATQALEQLLRQTNWKDLDYLIVDLPPGTGDIQLTLAQKIPVSGALIVSTPQDLSLLDARRAIDALVARARAGVTVRVVYDWVGALRAQLEAAGVEVLYDDRDERGGAKFATADLIGIPWQILIGPRGLAEGKVEIKRRSDGSREFMSLDEAINRFAK